MTSRALVVASAMCFAALGCKGSSDPGQPPLGLVSITVSTTSVFANGVNTVDVSVSTTGSGPISVSTNKGTFPGGVRTTSVAGSSGNLVLTTCNVATDATCPGTARITASAGGFSNSTSVTFGGYEMCMTSCNADTSCTTRPCTPAGGGTGTCSGTPPSAACAPPACSPSETPETSCGDGLDNDCDTLIDCADPGCSGQACQAGSPTFLCQSGACTDVASGAGISVTTSRTRLPADGQNTTPVVVRVTSAGQPQAGVPVTLSTTLGSLSATAATTGTDGTATVTFTASPTSGTATITAFLTNLPVVSQSTVVTMPALGSIQLGSLQFTVMGVLGSGYREIDAITVSVVDEQARSYPDGLLVRFEHVQLGGSRLSDPQAPDSASCVAAAGCVAYEAITDAAGLARVNLRSGRVAGTLLVTASATAGGLTRNFAVPNVAVIGARANGANLSIVCGPRNVPAFAETNCSTSLVDAQFTCVALLKDRFNNLLGTQTQVTFVAEAAAVGQVATTPPYDPSKDPTQQPDLGTATQIFRTLGAGLPFDVPPAPGEPSFSHALDGCGQRTHNPRDGALTVIAIADGEEAFFDANGNGIYDLGEPFIDLGEPYVDQDDDGQFDPGEWFLDANQTGLYDGPNGGWDPSIKLWTETVVVYTGIPVRLVDATTGLVTASRWAASASFAGACVPSAVPAPFSVNAPVAGPPPVPATSQSYLVVASDMNLNRLTSSTAYGAATRAPGKVISTYGGLSSYADDLGFFFQYWPCDQSGACASQCRATGLNLPCLMRPAITSYQCGITAGVTITGATPADGTNTVEWKVDTTYPVFNGSTVIRFVNSLTGTNN